MAFRSICGNSSVILVDEQDSVLGVQEKLRAHQYGGQLHRAFSIFILDDHGRILLQRRSRSKYHCPGLWANSCCSHPQPDIPIQRCARDRLQVELGFSVPLHKIGAVQYRLPLDNGMTEWEFDHIFTGKYSGTVVPNPVEVDEYRWVTLEQLERGIRNQREICAPWLSRIYPVLFEHLRGAKNMYSVGHVING